MKLATAAALDPEARYLDHERVIRELDEAERDHELDAAGVIEKLKEAINTCQAATDRYTAKAVEAQRAAEAYAVARGKYLAEIKRRVELPLGGRKTGKTPERIGFVNGCSQAGISSSNAYYCIKAAKGDMEPFRQKRLKSMESSRQSRARPTLLKIKSMWTYLTPAEREEFIRWALGGQDEAKAQEQRSSGRRVSSAEQLTQAQA